MGLVVVILAACIFVPFAVRYIQFALDPDLFDEDSLLLYVMSKFYDPELFPNDYASHYILSQWMPVGFVAVNRAWALFSDPQNLHRLLRCVLYFAAMPFVWSASRRVGGKVQAFAGLLLYASSINCIWRIVGGMPHSFAFLLLWWGISAQLAGRARQVAVCTVVSAAIYPAVTPILGIMLAIWLLFPSLTPGMAHDAPPFRLGWPRKLLWLAVPGAGSVLFVALLMVPAWHTYGPSVEMSHDFVAYPELVRSPGLDPFDFTANSFDQSHFLNGKVKFTVAMRITDGLFLIGLLGLLARDLRDRRPTALRPFLLAAALCFVGMYILDWEVSYRYAIYSFPILLTLYVPIGLRHLCWRLPCAPLRSGYFFGTLLMYAGLLSQAPAVTMGYNLLVEPEVKPLMNFLHGLPKDTMIAGWPGFDALQVIPYVTQRQMLIIDFSYTLAHRNYMLEMRRRMLALDNAYFGKEKAPLLTLRDEFGVDYLIINSEQLLGEAPPTYTEPYSTDIARMWWGDDKPFYVLSLYDKAGVFRTGPWQVLDLHKL